MIANACSVLQLSREQAREAFHGCRRDEGFVQNTPESDELATRANRASPLRLTCERPATCLLLENRFRDRSPRESARSLVHTLSLGSCQRGEGALCY